MKKSENSERQEEKVIRTPGHKLYEWLIILFMPIGFALFLIELGMFNDWVHLIESPYWRSFAAVGFISAYAAAIKYFMGDDVLE